MAEILNNNEVMNQILNLSWGVLWIIVVYFALKNILVPIWRVVWEAKMKEKAFEREIKWYNHKKEREDKEYYRSILLKSPEELDKEKKKLEAEIEDLKKGLTKETTNNKYLEIKIETLENKLKEEIKKIQC